MRQPHCCEGTLRGPHWGYFLYYFIFATFSAWISSFRVPQSPYSGSASMLAVLATFYDSAFWVKKWKKNFWWFLKKNIYFFFGIFEKKIFGFLEKKIYYFFLDFWKKKVWCKLDLSNSISYYTRILDIFFHRQIFSTDKQTGRQTGYRIHCSYWGQPRGPALKRNEVLSLILKI